MENGYTISNFNTVYLHEDAAEPPVDELALLNEAAKKLPLDDSHAGLHAKITDALYKKHVGPSDVYDSSARPQLKDVFDKHVVYKHKGSLKMANYHQKSDGTVHVGTPSRVVMSYTPAPAEGSPEEEARETADQEMREELLDSNTTGNMIVEDAITISEAAVFAQDGTKEVKIANAGWGSSGYYSKQLLMEQGPRQFPAGTQMFVDHDLDRIKSGHARSPKDLAARTVTSAYWKDEGKHGPGLYTRMKPYEPFKPFVESYAGDIGLSMSTFGISESGEIDGRKGKIVKEFLKSNLTSIDFVSKAGAGGMLPLYESYTEQHPIQHPIDKEINVDKNEFDLKLAEAKRENLVLCAKTFLLEKATEIGAKMSPKTLSIIASNPPVKDGRLDEAALTEALTEWVPDKTAAPAGKPTKVTNNGRDTLAEGATNDFGSLIKRHKSVFQSLGKFDDKTLDMIAPDPRN